MSWTPRYPNALFAKPLLTQAVAILQRDQQDALNYMGSSLDPISEFHLGSGYVNSMPWLLLLANQNTFNPDSYPFTREQDIDVQFLLFVGQFDQEETQDNAFDYMRMMDLVLTSASMADWVTALPITLETVPGGTTTPGQSTTVKSIVPLSQELNIVQTEEQESPLIQATLRYRFTLVEA